GYSRHEEVVYSRRAGRGAGKLSIFGRRLWLGVKRSRGMWACGIAADQALVVLKSGRHNESYYASGSNSDRR
ncbi:MAG: hypothetical protein WBF93_17080, partial [Pirellulales bacterium]